MNEPGEGTGLISTAKVSLQDPFQTRDMVQGEIINRFELLVGTLSQQIDWAGNTKYLNGDDVNTLMEMRKTLAAMAEAFNERTMQAMTDTGPSVNTLG